MTDELGLFAEVYLSWLPVWSWTRAAWMLAACVLVWMILRLYWGASQARGRVGLYVLRGLALLILAIIMLGPTLVDERAGEVVRPAVMYLFDSSQSMLLGQKQTRWDEALRLVSEAHAVAGDDHDGDVQAFRFGHRLEPLASPANEAPGAPEAASRTVSPISTKAKPEEQVDPPTASDSRLADALRQLLPQVSARESAGVVLLSDGRVRASDSVERLAEYFGEAKVPLHVVPLGEVSGNGDVAIVSLVVPPRVRKYTEHQLQVFLRSFGFPGQRTVVRVISRNKIGDTDSATLASVPITLSGGAQSASLTFRVNQQPEDLLVVVDPVPGELTERNNQVTARVEIDRTKVRVLYLEGDSGAQQPSGILDFFSFSSPAPSAASTASVDVQEALQSDEDIECTILISDGVNPPRSMPTGTSYAATGYFPKTRAELFAYDCVVFNELAPNVLTEEQNEWLAQWIEGRGGGLIVAGSKTLTEPTWSNSLLMPLLPIDLAGTSSGLAEQAEVDVVMPQHPVWRLRLEHKPNQQMLLDLPPLSVATSNYPAKPTAEVLAERRDDGEPVMLAHRVGRGRVFVSTASLGGSSYALLADQWGPQPERVAAKFWRNLVYWATEGSSTGRRRLVAESDKVFYRPGDSLTISATTYDEAARRTDKYQVWAMVEPESLDDTSLYSPLLWPENVVRESGEVSPRIAWGEEFPLAQNPTGDDYAMTLMLSETGSLGDSGMRIEMTAYEGAESDALYGHGTQVDSSSLAIQVLTDPFEQQNPLPNHELLERVAALSGGEVIHTPEQLAALLQGRQEVVGPPHRDLSPAWSRWWLWATLLGLLSAEWVWRRMTGLA